MSAPATQTQTEAKSQGSILAVVTTVLSPIETLFGEVSHFTPVIFTFGSLFLSVITLNYPIFLFALASGEALLLLNGLKAVSEYFATADSIKESSDLGKNPKCKSSYQGSEATKFKYLLDNGLSRNIPNSPLYFITFAATYCIQSMYIFSKECYERGAAYSSRPYLAYLSAGMSIILFSIYLLIYSCDTPLGITLSIVAGVLVGLILCNQNLFFFGKAGVDMLFIPPLISRKGMDYICVSTN